MIIKVFDCEETAPAIIESINDSFEHGELSIHVNSLGGGIAHVRSLAFALKHAKRCADEAIDEETGDPFKWDYHVVTFLAYSAACMFLFMLPPEKVFAHKSAEFMLHGASFEGLSGRLKDIQSQVDFALAIETKENFNLLKGRIPDDVYQKILQGEDVYFDANQALEWGIISKIVD